MRAEKQPVYAVTRLGEFANPELENQYNTDELAHAPRFFRSFVVVFGILFALACFFDFYDSYGQLPLQTLWRVFTARALVLVFAAGFYFITGRGRSAQWTLAGNTAFFALALFTFVLLAVQTREQDYLHQAISLLVLVICAAWLPMRWISYTLIASLAAAAFFLRSLVNWPAIRFLSYLEATLFVAVAIAVAAVGQYHMNMLRHMHYARENRLEELSHTDKLTGIRNRHWFDKTLAEWCVHGEGGSRGFALILFDIDRFKDVNDRFGHPAGDKVLCGICHKVLGLVRPGDLFSRWGGEEFILLLPSTGDWQAYRLAERLRGAIEQTPTDGVGRVTCSFGVVVRRANETPDELVQRADTQLYKAKQGGRNRVEMDGTVLYAARRGGVPHRTATRS